jgi:hypothetical protein
MPSLTSILPALAPILELTPQALYERQRSLIRLGLLPAPERRGKVGAAASPETVALLLMTAMVTDNLSDTDDRVRKLALAPFVDGKKDRCPWTGAAVFKDALAFILSAKSAFKRGRDAPTASVRVSRANAAASIWFDRWPKMTDPRSRGRGISEFGEFYRRSGDKLRIEAELPNGALNEIRRLLSNEGSS